MLTFDPLCRISVDEALKHPYLATHYRPKDIIIGRMFTEDAFEKAETLEEIREYIWKEIQLYHPTNTNFLFGSRFLPNSPTNSLKNMLDPNASTASHKLSTPKDDGLQNAHQTPDQKPPISDQNTKSHLKVH
jgi:hypothetical protein